MKKAVLELNEYQASNLRWLLQLVQLGHVPATNTGDWCGEIPYLLDVAMIEAGHDYRPNATAENYFKGRESYGKSPIPANFPMEWENWPGIVEKIKAYQKHVREWQEKQAQKNEPVTKTSTSTEGEGLPARSNQADGAGS